MFFIIIILFYLRIVVLADGGSSRIVASQTGHGSVQTPKFAFVETGSAGHFLVLALVAVQLFREAVGAGLAGVAALAGRRRRRGGHACRPHRTSVKIRRFFYNESRSLSKRPILRAGDLTSSLCIAISG